MRARPFVIAFVMAASFGPIGARAGEILNVGDPAPPLAVSEWVKGEKVDGFEPGKTYVIEFWATWCGPCRATIPHLTELAHKFKDQGVRFVGVDVWEQDTKLVKPFVDEMGDKMDYSVALDRVPEGGKADDGAMATTWMKAAAENGIPTAFVVRDGTIAWIGHPIRLDEPLAKIVAGDWDPKADAEERLVRKRTEQKAMAVRQKIYGPYSSGDYKATVAAIDEVTSDDPELAQKFATVKFAALCNGGEPEAGLELGTRLLERHKDEAGILNDLAWSVVDPELKEEPDPAVAKLALEAARRSNELTKGENLAVLDTLAAALFRTGDAAGALAAEEKAYARLEAEVEDRSHPQFKQMRDRIDVYRKAVSGGDERP